MNKNICVYCNHVWEHELGMFCPKCARFQPNKLSFEEQELLRHKKLYYNGTPEISDPEYDALEEVVKERYPNSPVILEQVGYELDEEEKEYLIKHNKEMKSLDKTFEIDKIVDWAEGEILGWGFKLDGTAISLVYDTSGNLKHGKTRGDGIFGKNVTEQFNYIDIPKILDLSGFVLTNGEVEIRGEGVITEDNFKKLVIECNKRNIKPPKARRNAASGLLNPGKKHDVDLAKYLDFVAYEILGIDYEYMNENENYTILLNQGFNITRHGGIQSDKKSIQSAIDTYKNMKDDYKYLTDGIVFAVGDTKKQILRGSTGHHYKGKLAFKLKGETAVTKVLDIVERTNRTGKVSFTGIVEPVNLSGATISKVTFHNAAQMKFHQVAIGDEIEIIRSGEVIPKILKVVKHNGKFNLPTHCNSCGSKLEWTETGADLMCYNENCDSKNVRKIIHWIKSVGIEEVGEKTIQVLFDKGIIGNVFDLYTLKPGDIVSLEGFGERSEEIVLENIKKKIDIPINKMILGMGIHGIGKTFSKALVQEYPNIEAMKKATFEDLIKIEDIGDILAKDFIYYMPDIDVFYKSLKNVGVNIIDGEKKVVKSNKIAGLHFVITGTLSKGRAVIKAMIEENGGKVSSSVSGTTDYLVAGEDCGSKLQKAKDKGITIISEDELYEMV